MEEEEEEEEEKVMAVMAVVVGGEGLCIARFVALLLHTGLEGVEAGGKESKDSSSAVLVAALRFNYVGQPAAVIRGLGLHVLKPFFA